MRARTLKSLTIFSIQNLETNQEDSHHPHQQFAGPKGIIIHIYLGVFFQRTQKKKLNYSYHPQTKFKFKSC